jgi:hypothetical protein
MWFLLLYLILALGLGWWFDHDDMDSFLTSVLLMFGAPVITPLYGILWLMDHKEWES